MSNDVFCRRRWAVFWKRSADRYAMKDMFKTKLRRLQTVIGYWCQLAEAYREDHPGTKLVMVMLSYADADDWDAGDIRAYMKSVKQSLGDGVLGWAWVAEIQAKRLAKMIAEGHPDPRPVHYHVMFMTDGVNVPMPDRSYWHKGASNIQKARTPYYLAKYIGKEHQKDFSRFPKHCRTYGQSIRWSDEAKSIHRMLCDKALADPNDEWEFVGSAVTEGYARHVLIPGGRDV